MHNPPSKYTFATRAPRVTTRQRHFATSHPECVEDEALFSYTSGRFLYNEQTRLAERYVKFDASALRREISKHVDHGTVTKLVKLGEGGFNRVLLATMEDGFRVIVKIPYWIAVPKTYATASEVATLTFLRSKGIPVPEYIIMEYAPGVGADTKWFKNTKYQKKELVTGIIDAEKTLLNIRFGAIGSIYFKTDLSPELRCPLYAHGMVDEAGDSETYCIGPIADYMFWYGRRGQLDIDRGPWKSPTNYLRAIAEKEVKWIEEFGKPTEPGFPHNTVFPGMRSPNEYLRLLKRYSDLVPYLLPKKEGHILNRPTLRHPDLTLSNIFIDPEPFQVTSIIDWQHTAITPLAQAAGYPRLFENPDPEHSAELVPPKLPPNYETLQPADRAQVDELIRRQSLFYLYRVFNGGLNKLHLEALRDPLLRQRQQLIDPVNRQWSGDLITLRGELMRMRDLWPYLPGRTADTADTACPIDFSEEEIREQAEMQPMWHKLNALVEHWRDELGGISEEGWIPAEEFDAAVERNKALEAEFSDGGSLDELAKIERGWPFQDHQEVY
ncbi:serine/threonine protein kinase [Aspergillus heterothallicus]